MSRPPLVRQRRRGQQEQKSLRQQGALFFADPIKKYADANMSGEEKAMDAKTPNLSCLVSPTQEHAVCLWLPVSVQHYSSHTHKLRAFEIEV